MIIIPDNCDIIGDGQGDDCDCSQDNLFEKAAEIFEKKDFQQLGQFTLQIIDNCTNKNPIATTTKKKRAPNAYNLFMKEFMKGCGKDDKEACKVMMKKGAIAWQEQKKKASK